MTIYGNQGLVDELSRKFDRHNSEPSKVIWSGNEVKEMTKSNSTIIPPLVLNTTLFVNKDRNSLDTNNHEQRSISSRRFSQSKTGFHPEKGSTSDRKLRESPRVYYSLTLGDGTEIPRSKKEVSTNKSVVKHLTKVLKNQGPISLSSDVIENKFLQICYECVDEVFEEATGAKVEELAVLIERSVSEIENRAFTHGELLDPVIQRLLHLKSTLEEYIVNDLKVRTCWTDEFLSELSYIKEYFEKRRVCIKGENKVQFFLDFVNKKIKDSMIYALIIKSIQPNKGEAQKIVNSLETMLNKDIRAIVDKYVLNRSRVQQLSSKTFTWKETEDSSCKLSCINREGMVSSIIRDFVNKYSSISVNGEVIDVTNLLQLKSEEKLKKKFFKMITRQILPDNEVEKTVTAILKNEESVLDSILWSCCFHAWANAENLLQSKLMDLSLASYVIFKEKPAECVINANVSHKYFCVRTTKNYSLYIRDKNSGLFDKSNPFMTFKCSWQLSPRGEGSTLKWSGELSLADFKFVKGVSLDHRNTI